MGPEQSFVRLDMMSSCGILFAVLVCHGVGGGSSGLGGGARGGSSLRGAMVSMQSSAIPQKEKENGWHALWQSSVLKWKCLKMKAMAGAAGPHSRGKVASRASHAPHTWSRFCSETFETQHPMNVAPFLSEQNLVAGERQPGHFVSCCCLFVPN